MIFNLRMQVSAGALAAASEMQDHDTRLKKFQRWLLMRATALFAAAFLLYATVRPRVPSLEPVSTLSHVPCDPQTDAAIATPFAGPLGQALR